MSEGAEGQGSSHQAIQTANVVIKKAATVANIIFARSKKIAVSAQPRHIRWAIVVVWLAFIAAFLSSNFFIVAHNAGLYAALEAGAILGPLHTITIVPCDIGFHDFTNGVGCGVYDNVPSFSISLKLVFIICTITSAGLWFWASERARKSQKD